MTAKANVQTGAVLQVLMAALGSLRGVAVSNGINPKYGDLDPYRMAASAIDEALRNLVAGGCTLDEVALLGSKDSWRTGSSKPLQNSST